MVRRRRSTTAGLQHAELVGDDWELPSSIDLTRRSRNPRRSFGNTRTASRWPLATARGLAGARVSVPTTKLREEEGIAVLGLIHGGGSLFIDVQGRRLSSDASIRRRGSGICRSSTELLPGERMTTTFPRYFERSGTGLISGGLARWAGSGGLRPGFPPSYIFFSFFSLLSNSILIFNSDLLI
jgi:hypothetical protein